MRSYAGSPVEDDDDGIIEMRSSSHRNHTQTMHLVRSQSKVSTASSSSSTSTTSTNTSHSHASTDTTSPAGSLSPSRMVRKPSPSSSSTATARRYSSSTYRPSLNTYTTRRGQPPPLIRTPSEHVTIAPIAPTILKTTGVWSEGFGDEEESEDGFGSWDTKGLWSGQDTYASNGKKGKGKTTDPFGLGGGSDKEGQSSDGTPVELVYVPPFESNHSLGLGNDGYLDEDQYKEPEEYRDMIGRKVREGVAWDVYHHQTATGSVGLSDSNKPSIPSRSSPSTTASIPIVRSPTPGLPSVVVDDQTTTSALSASGLVTSRGSSKAGNRQWSSVDEEYGYDFFGGPDLGEDYYHAQRSSREYTRSGVGSSSFSSERQRERERERRTVAQGGEERQSRSRSRSQSRTPSPAFISSPVSAAPAPTASNSQVPSGRKRSSSALATPSGSFITTGPLTNDFLGLPPQRGRNMTQPQPQSQTRGRSSTRTASSSSSWDREGGSSVGSSPMGSLSPDGLAAGGRGREKAKERENERGRERKGREKASSQMLGTSETVCAASSGARAGSGSSSTSITHDAGGANDRVMTDSNISSTTSSCSSSTSTVMGRPSSDAITVNIDPINEDQHRANFLQQQGMTYMRCAEERRRVHPTPSSSPVMGMRMSVHPEARSGELDQRDDNTPGRTTFPNMVEPVPFTPPPSPILTYSGVGHSRSSSYSESASTVLSSPSKLRPPPLIPPPPLLVKPSTSFTAVSSSLPASPIISTKGFTSASSGEHTIVAKAVDIVSSAGAFLGLWQHSSIPADK
jgi:hypothetical protein